VNHARRCRPESQLSQAGLGVKSVDLKTHPIPGAGDLGHYDLVLFAKMAPAVLV
jgi:hypothetical protein